MSGTDVCPCCPKMASSKGDVVRSDNLRLHVKNKHAEAFDAEFIDAGGWAIRVLAPKLIVKTKAGKMGFGYCFKCFHWVTTRGMNQSNIERYIRDHDCKEPVTRERKLKVVGGKIEVSVKKGMDDKALMTAFKACGADDYIEFNEDLDIDLKKTLKRMMAQMKAPAPVNPDGILERLKKEVRLASLNLPEREAQRRDAIESNNLEAEDDDEIEIETFDEYDDIIMPCFVELARAAPQREKLSNTIKELRAQMDQKEDAADMKQRELERTIADLKERVIEMSRDISEERVRLHAREARLKEKSAEAVSQEPDKIELVGGSDYVQWSLPYQG